MAAFGVGVGLLSGLSFLVGMVIAAGTGRAQGESMKIAFGGIAIVLLVGTLVASLYGRRFRGSLLLDCGSHPARSLFFMNTVLFLLPGIRADASNWQSPLLLIAAGGPVFSLLFAMFWLTNAVGRVQLRQAGIWNCTELIAWNRIEYYQWGPDSTVYFKRRGWIPGFSQGAIHVPVEQKEEFSAILERHCCTPQHSCR